MTASPAALQPTDFDHVAAAYDASLPAHVVEHYLRKRLEFIGRHTRPGPALDVGCGTGRLAERLAGAGYCVVGVDPSQGMLEVFGARRPDIPRAAADGTALPFPDGTFDLTYCVAVLHHVADPAAVGRVLGEMARVTRPAGHLIVWDHNPDNPYWPILMRRVPQDTGGERLIGDEEVRRGLRAGGAGAIVCAKLGLVPDFVPPPLLGAARLVERLVEATPGLRRLCAHNVVLATKCAPST